MPMKRFTAAASDLWENVQASAAAVQKICAWEPEVAVILGTGLGALAQRIKKEAEISYRDIPHFPVSTVESHAGNLILGTLAGKRVAAMEGRFHYYEGYSLTEVTFPVRVMKALGARQLLVSNAAGGLNLAFPKGALVLIEDMINFMGANPLRGANDERLGPRFPDMCEPFSKRLLAVAEEAARKKNLDIHRGVYVGVSGPNLETRAEYRMLRNWGADLVGMSTVPEVIVAVHMGMEVLGVSVVTDVCDPDHLEPVDIREIIRTANEAGPRLDALFEETIRRL